ncbi:hypothetical protein PAAG_03841 [Paracoccidioides lutzii Pb01]|uniref:Uncharacterized protein n=1 Tax=Paracoccidioides lutzii (strain ATCC MYA-826 / Pb01) TaxID=502779 RepID=C1GZ97_PARBA|nr:hypothetical protein PAAG_03841 [Paracoccidioides lutzii Pb01]EEH41920.1 hypothetical protein PAAG_03841 [Paracoccidioides lutzii Pb01]
MVVFRLPNILCRNKRPQTTATVSTPPAQMPDGDSLLQGSHQDKSPCPPHPNDQKQSWTFRYLSSALSGSVGWTVPAIDLSISSMLIAKPANDTSNNVCRLPPSVKRQLFDSTIKTPTRNTDIPLPTIIHPNTPLSPSSSSLSSFSTSPTRTKPCSTRSTRRPTQLKPILKTAISENLPHTNRHTSQSDTQANTSRNVFLTLNDVSNLDETVPPRHFSTSQSPSTHMSRHSLSFTSSRSLVSLDDPDQITETTVEHPFGNQEAKVEKAQRGVMDKKRASSCGGGPGESVGMGREIGASGASDSCTTNRKAKKMKQKMVRFDHVDVHPYEVERSGESCLSFYNEQFVVPKLDLDLDLKEYVVDIPDIIER